MEERIIIEGKPSKKISTILLWIGLLLLIAGLILFLKKTGFWLDLRDYPFKDIWGLYLKELGDCILFLHGWYFAFVSVILDLGILLILTGLFRWLSIKKTCITVTNKRVYGVTKWGKRVDLPLNQISVVSTSRHKGISVGTSSGRIVFKAIENHIDVHKEITNLLATKQDSATEKPDNMRSNNIEDLKKYKDLLDSGIITQEEFDAKKKQLLEL